MRSKYNCIVFLILKYKTKPIYFIIMSNNLIKRIYNYIYPELDYIYSIQDRYNFSYYKELIWNNL